MGKSIGIINETTFTERNDFTKKQSLSKKIRQECEIPTIAVGLITELNMIEEILANERADLVAIGRELLRNPQFVIQEAYKNKIDITIPKQVLPLSCISNQIFI